MLKITVLSARYGFLDSRSPIQNYGTHFTGEFADRMMGGGLGHAGHGRLFPQDGQFRDRRGLRDGFAQGAWRSAFHRFPLRLASVLDRKSVGRGNRVSVRGELRGRRIIKETTDEYLLKSYTQAQYDAY